MSEENEGEEDKQKDDFAWSEEFDFYFPFTKPLVLDLPTEEDRVLASAWVQKLEAEPETDEDKKIRLNYLKLLLFTLQRGQLGGIFKKEPPSGPLEPFPPGFSIFDMANWMLEEDDTPTCGAGDAGHVPYTIEMSNDLREFIASQEIPNFGVQMYYAWSSDEAIDKWTFFDEEKFPQYILDKIKQLQESKSDEKSFIMKNGCFVKKKGCNLSVPDKYLQRKVKSPQEIERSQGRSFHTYMGLIGRMGNFNDKCDDDPKKFQRQDQRKVKCPRRSDQKKCPGSGGEAEDDEEFDTTLRNLSGLDSINRPCFCPFPCHHSSCPEHPSKGEPQLSNYEDRRTPDRNCAFNLRSEPETPQWGASVGKTTGQRRVRDHCLENEMTPPMPCQKRSVSPRPRSSSPNRPNLECPQQDNSREFPSSGVCTCSSSQCPCPCPRFTAKISVHQTPSTSRGRDGPDPCRTFLRSPKQNSPFNENRRMGTYATSFNAPEPSPVPRRQDLSPVGGRTGPAMRPVQPEVIHCYDNQNPDPAIAKGIESSAEWVQTMSGGSRFLNSDLKMACRRDQIISSAQQNKCKVSSRKELFGSQQQSVSPPRPNPCLQSTGTRRSPPLETHPICDHSPSEEGAGPCPTRQQRIYPQQNYIECEDAPPQPCYGFHESYGRQAAETYKKPGPQATTRVKNTSNYYPSSSFALRKDTGRLADMSSVLQGIKQKTDAHREKCTQMRSPEICPENRVCQPPEAALPPSTPPNRVSVYSDHSTPTGRQLNSTPYPCYPDRLKNYQQDECDLEYEEEDECPSSESLEACPPGPSANEPPKNVMQSCQQQDFSDRDDAVDLGKTLAGGSYGVTFTEIDDSKFVTLGSYSSDQDKSMIPDTYVINSYTESESSTCGPQSPGRTRHRTPVNISQRDCRYQKTSPKRAARPESAMNVTPRDIKTIPGESPGRTPRPQWVTPRVSENRYFNRSFEACTSPIYQPVTSTPIEQCDMNYREQNNEDMSPIRPPSSRCS